MSRTKSSMPESEFEQDDGYDRLSELESLEDFRLDSLEAAIADFYGDDAAQREWAEFCRGIDRAPFADDDFGDDGDTDLDGTPWDSGPDIGDPVARRFPAA
jgi:hypothetical protein